MRMTLVITHYKEPWEVCKPLFDSIAYQLGMDFENLEIILVEDSTDKKDYLSWDFVQYYPFEINFIADGHSGVSGARNKGLDNATGDYIMFCDCDDRFISAYAFHLYTKQMDKYDIIKSPFIEDQIINGELKLIRHEHDISFIHGKMYKRSFLLDNNIRFNENLTIHEDGYFNVLANIIADTSIHEMSPAVYLWKWNDDSVVRKDRELYIYKTYDHLMKCRSAICKELWDRGYIDKYFPSIIKTVVDSYYDFQKPEALKPENKELIKKAEKAFADFYKEFGKDYKECNINDIAQMMYICRSTAFANGLRVEQETLSEFLTRIVKEY